MNQGQLLAETLLSIKEHSSPESQKRIQECLDKLQATVNEYGEDGMMSLAIAGLSCAVMAERLEELENVK